MQKEIKASIIIPTYNRQEELKELLISLEGQTYPREEFEIIIIDDGSTDGTKDAVARYIADHKDCAILYHRQENAGPAAARNKGIQMSRGKLLLFTDTDCVAPPEWIEKITEPLWNNHDVGITGGPDTVSKDAPFLIRCINYLMTSFFTTGGIRGGKLRLTEFSPRSFNMAVKKEVFDKTGKFLYQKYAEDTLLSEKTKKAGYRSLYCHEAFVYHFRRDRIMSFLKQVHGMAKGTAIASKSEKGVVKFLNFIPPLALMIIPLAIILLSLFFNNFIVLKIYIFIGLIYLALISISCIVEQKSLAMALCIPFLFLVQQIAYAIGFLSGLLKTKVRG
ncbi:glycosyltransferase [Candidatus Omnitrophota bacterium]